MNSTEARKKHLNNIKGNQHFQDIARGKAGLEFKDYFPDGIDLKMPDVEMPKGTKKFFGKVMLAYVALCIAGAGFSIGCIIALAMGLKWVFVG